MVGKKKIIIIISMFIYAVFTLVAVMVMPSIGKTTKYAETKTDFSRNIPDFQDSTVIWNLLFKKKKKKFLLHFQWILIIFNCFNFQ